MKLIGFLLMTLGLCLGAIAATTAYVPKLDQPSLAGTTLNAQAGIARADNPALINAVKQRPVFASTALHAVHDARPAVTVGDDSQPAPAGAGRVNIVQSNALPAGIEWDDRGAASSAFSHFLLIKGLTRKEIVDLRKEFEHELFVDALTKNPEAISTIEQWLQGRTTPLTREDVTAAIESGQLPALLSDREYDPAYLRAWKDWVAQAKDAANAQSEADEDPESDSESAPQVAPVFPPAIAWSPDTIAVGLPAMSAWYDAAPLHLYTYLAGAALGDEPLQSLMLTDDLEKAERDAHDLAYDGQIIHKAAEDYALVPLARKPNTLTPDLVSALETQSIARVRVKEFSFARWDYWWMMAGAIIALVAGAMLVKAQTRREIAAHLDKPADHAESPEQAMKHIRATIDQLIAELPSMPNDHDRLEAIIERIGNLQQTHLEAIVGARMPLVARLGMGGFAQFMDRFSAMERNLNRAWSAAADDALDESQDCLRTAHELIPAVEGKLAHA